MNDDKQNAADEGSLERDETVSLTELMRRRAAEVDGEEDTAVLDDGITMLEPVAEPRPVIITLPDLALEDAPTATSELEIPDETPRPMAPPPIYREGLTPRRRPTQTDLEATKVSTRPFVPPVRASQSVPPEQMPTRPVRAQARPEPVLQGTPIRQESRPAVPPPPPPKVSSQTGRGGRLPRPTQSRSVGGCMRRLAITAVLLGFFGFVFAIIGASIGYIYIASDLPSVGELRSRASTFETARIYDSAGNELYALADPNAGNRTSVSIDQISPFLINATIATEDSRFRENTLGFDPIAIGRAVITAVREGDAYAGGGASTITQQLARALLLDDEERGERTIRRKIREIILAAEMDRTYDKDTILELYLNEINYGNRAYGIQAAAETYFNKSAADLTLSEASLLAGLPQAPAWWDPFVNPEQAIGRQWEVLLNMSEQGYVTAQEAQAAINEMNLRIGTLTPPRVDISHPHFVFTVLQQLETANDAQSIYRGGLRVYTTLEPGTQRLAEDVLAANRGNINSWGANNGAVVSMDPRTGAILALVGSLDYNDESISGQVNMAMSPRQPGSTIKPFVYLAAMQKGWTASTLLWDIETQFPDGSNPPYVPKNYDNGFHGPLLLREALGNSYNITAVKALEQVGVCDFIAFMNRVVPGALNEDGCVNSNPRQYGLALSLGGGEISPLQMATAYSTLANGGQRAAPYAISRIEDKDGNVLFEHVAPEPEQVVSADAAYVISDILSDNGARQPSFGQNNNLIVGSHRVAAKTGTSGTDAFDVRDGWTIGYTPEVVTAVWVGNTDNQPVAEGGSGYRMASPVWNGFMSQYLAARTPAQFVRPVTVVDREICAASGTIPSASCGNRKVEIFAQAQLPLGAEEDFLQSVPVDLWTGLRANEACGESVYEASFVNLLVFGPDETVRQRETRLAQTWLETTGQGRDWAGQRSIGLPLRLPPERYCDGSTPRPIAEFVSPPPQSELTGIYDFVGTAKAPNFAGYALDYGFGFEPEGWGELTERGLGEVENGVLFRWDTDELSDRIGQSGAMAVRLTVFGPDNPYTAEDDPVRVMAVLPFTLLAPTATPTRTPTSTPVATATSEPTSTATATATAQATIRIPTATPFVSPTPTAAATIVVPATETVVPATVEPSATSVPATSVPATEEATVTPVVLVTLTPTPTE